MERGERRDERGEMRDKRGVSQLFD